MRRRPSRVSRARTRRARCGRSPTARRSSRRRCPGSGSGCSGCGRPRGTGGRRWPATRPSACATSTRHHRRRRRRSGRPPRRPRRSARTAGWIRTAGRRSRRARSRASRPPAPRCGAMSSACSPACMTQPQMTSSTIAGIDAGALGQAVEHLRGQLAGMHTRQAAVALADRRPHGLDDDGFSHGDFSFEDGLGRPNGHPEGRGTRFTRSTYWLVGRAWVIAMPHRRRPPLLTLVIVALPQPLRWQNASVTCGDGRLHSQTHGASHRRHMVY